MVVANLKVAAGAGSQAVRDELERGALAIQALARDYAPMETGSLEQAIAVESKNGRREFVVGIDPKELNTKSGEPVTRYAEEMELNYDAYEPGRGTLAKRAAGQRAGGFFLFRATKELEPKIMKRIRAAVAAALARLKK